MEQQILEFFALYTYQPWIVYSAILGAMFICSLGVPIPEEIIIVSAGLVGHMSLNPADYPPPFPGAPSVHPYTLAMVCFSSVILTDYFIYSMGKFFGSKIFASQRFGKHFPEEKLLKIRTWAKKYGLYAPGIFRFIPGLRFPGHMMCGAIGVPTWAFLLTDGTAALLSVPTQVLLVSFYGHDILQKFKEFKLAVLAVLAVLLTIYLIRRYIFNKKSLSALS
jgi:membrane protein DedA with SNARE-associated domain